MGDLLPGIELPGEKEGNVLGQFLVKRLPYFKGAFSGNPFEIQLRGLLGLFFQIIRWVTHILLSSP
jgi:hypothetical protein